MGREFQKDLAFFKYKSRVRVMFSICLGLLLFSCQNELEEMENPILSPKENPYKVSVDEAQDIALQFMKDFYSSVPSARSSSMTIQNVEVFRADNANSRGLDADKGIDTLLYAVNFSNNEGCVLVAADKRTDPVYGVLDESMSSMDEVENNPGFSFFLDLAAEKILNDVQSDSGNSSSSMSRSLGDYSFQIGFYPHYLLYTRWGQDSPYNRYCPGPYTGCVVVAISQILSHFPVIESVSWQSNGTSEGCTLHWNQIYTDCAQQTGYLHKLTNSPSLDEVAHLMRYLGIKFNAEYKSDGTSVNSGDALKWLKENTRLNVSDLKSYDINEIAFALPLYKSNKLVYMRGYDEKKSFLGIATGYRSGHAWVIDGWVDGVHKSDGVHHMFHCNWGWNGESNGFFLAGVFDVQSPTIMDSEITSGVYSGLVDEDFDFRYKVQYSIIEDPNVPSFGGSLGGN